jgi:hypothetical protein
LDEFPCERPLRLREQCKIFCQGEFELVVSAAVSVDSLVVFSLIVLFLCCLEVPPSYVILQGLKNNRDISAVMVCICAWYICTV